MWEMDTEYLLCDKHYNKIRDRATNKSDTALP